MTFKWSRSSSYNNKPNLYSTTNSSYSFVYHDWTITEDDFRNSNWSYYYIIDNRHVPITHIHIPYRVGPNYMTTITLYDNRQFCKEVDIFYILDKQDSRQYKIEQIV